MQTLPLICAGITLALAGAFDFRTGKIPNFITLGSLALSLLWLFIEPQNSWSNLLGILSLSLLPFLLFMHSKGRGIGGGDIKLLAALGSWLGPELGLAVTVTALVLAAFFGCFQALRNRRPLAEVQIRLGPFFALAYSIVLIFGSYEELASLPVPL